MCLILGIIWNIRDYMENCGLYGINTLYYIILYYMGPGRAQDHRGLGRAQDHRDPGQAVDHRDPGRAQDHRESKCIQNAFKAY